MSKDLFDYFRRIEEAFCGRRGAPLLLSPLDFEKVVEWFGAGISPEVVEEGINAHFTKLEKRKVPPRRSICISFAETEILKILETRRAAAIGRSAGVPDGKATAEIRSAYLKRGARRLETFAANKENRERMPVTSRFVAATSTKLLVFAESPSSAAELEKQLGPLDRELGKLLLLESPPELLDRWRREALVHLGEFAQSMAKEALEQTLEGFMRRAADSLWDLPRLSLLYM